MLKPAHLFTDADNTLWDTDAVFAEAQLAMLREIEGMTGQNAPAAEDRGLAFLRKIDQRIAASHPDHLRYPPSLLARGLEMVLGGVDPDSVVQHILQRESPESLDFREVQQRFIDRLAELPRLREGVQEGLLAISQAGVPVTVVTEERLERCKRVLSAHSLDPMVSTVVSIKKSVAAFISLAQPLQGARLFMVGDQFDRDIQAASAAGFQTFYFPGGFQPYWVGDLPTGTTRKISRYDAMVPDVLAR